MSSNARIKSSAPDGAPFDRFIVVVVDGGGVGATPDAKSFGEIDANANTIGHIREAVGLELPALERMGLARITPGWGLTGDGLRADDASAASVGELGGAFGRMAELSVGKDTQTGHWEMAGCRIDTQFPTYPDGFPDEVIRPFEEAVGKEVLWNKPASGTEILERFGAEHQRTGRPIVYTSGDSVFQIAAHEEIVPVETLYDWCEKARAILVPPHEVGRVIARPFVGAPGSFERTHRRHDYSIPPPPGHLLERLAGAGYDVYAVGKIEDIFAGRGVVEAIHTESNAHGIELTLDAIESRRDRAGLIFTNLVDFDSKFGHRRDPKGYRGALEELDRELPKLLSALGERDALVITADHGNDPTAPGTDHTREYVPLLVSGPRVAPRCLGDRSSFADLGQTIADCFGLKVDHGESCLPLLVDRAS